MAAVTDSWLEDWFWSKPSSTAAYKFSYLNRLLTEDNPGYLWVHINVAYGLQGMPRPDYTKVVLPGRITQASLYRAMGYNKLIPSAYKDTVLVERVKIPGTKLKGMRVKL